MLEKLQMPYWYIRQYYTAPPYRLEMITNLLGRFTFSKRGQYPLLIWVYTAIHSQGIQPRNPATPSYNSSEILYSDARAGGWGTFHTYVYIPLRLHASCER